jgi:hypothetical protein
MMRRQFSARSSTVCLGFHIPSAGTYRCGDPGKYGDGPFQLVFLGAAQVFFIVEKRFPVIHAQQFHGHGGHFGDLHRVFFERTSTPVRCARKECTAWPPSCTMVVTSLICPAAFMKIKGAPLSVEGTVITARRLAFTALKVKMIHFIHLAQAIGEKWIQAAGNTALICSYSSWPFLKGSAASHLPVLLRYPRDAKYRARVSAVSFHRSYRSAAVHAALRLHETGNNLL